MPIADKLLELGLTIAWRLHLVHVPDWDNLPNPWLDDQVPVLDPPPAAAVKKPDVQANWGEDDPFRPAKVVSYNETVIDDPDADGSWEYSRYDGKNKTPDFRIWHETDEEELLVRGFTTDKTRENYIKVRALVIDGKTNRQIADVCGKGISWAEMYAAAVRAAFKRRPTNLPDPSPTGFGEGEEEE